MERREVANQSNIAAVARQIVSLMHFAHVTRDARK
jgi:hypothetical protein